MLLEILTTPPVRLNSTLASIDYDGDTYQAGGMLGVIEPVEDKTGENQGLRFQMSGIASDVLAKALADDIRGAQTTLYAQVYSKPSNTLLDTVQVWSGTMDQMPISLDETLTISAIGIHRGDTFGRPKPLRNTDADQQKLVPGDISRRFVISQSQKQDVWPAASFFRQ